MLDERSQAAPFGCSLTPAMPGAPALAKAPMPTAPMTGPEDYDTAIVGVVRKGLGPMGKLDTDVKKAMLKIQELAGFAQGQNKSSTSPQRRPA